MRLIGIWYLMISNHILILLKLSAQYLEHLSPAVLNAFAVLWETSACAGWMAADSSKKILQECKVGFVCRSWSDVPHCLFSKDYITCFLGFCSVRCALSLVLFRPFQDSLDTGRGCWQAAVGCWERFVGRCQAQGLAGSFAVILGRCQGQAGWLHHWDGSSCDWKVCQLCSSARCLGPIRQGRALCSEGWVGGLCWEDHRLHGETRMGCNFGFPGHADELVCVELGLEQAAERGAVVTEIGGCGRCWVGVRGLKARFNKWKHGQANRCKVPLYYSTRYLGIWYTEDLHIYM